MWRCSRCAHLSSLISLLIFLLISHLSSLFSSLFSSLISLLISPLSSHLSSLCSHLSLLCRLLPLPLSSLLTLCPTPSSLLCVLLYCPSPTPPLPPTVLPLSHQDVTVVIKDLNTKLEVFAWAFDKKNGFPRVKDAGTAEASLGGLSVTISFQMVSSSASLLAIDNLTASLALDSIDVVVHQSSQGSARKWLYNKLIAAFRERLRSDVQDELKAQLRQVLSLLWKT